MTDNIFPQMTAHLWRGGRWAYAWTPDSGEWYTNRAGEKVQAKITQWQPATRPLIIPAAWERRNTYFSVHPCTAIPTTYANGKPARPHNVRGRQAYIAAVNALFAEFDVKPGQYPSIDAAFAHVETLPYFPTVVIHSGGGLHAYWFLEYPVMLDESNRDHLRRLQAAWVKLVGADDVKDLERVLRVPGSLNLKPHFAPDFPTVKVLEHRLERVFQLWRFEEVCANALAAMQHVEERAQATDATRTGTAGGAAERLVDMAERRAGDGSRHHQAVILALRLKAEGLAPWAIQSNLMEFARRVNHGGARTLDAKEMTQITQWAVGSGR